MCQAYRRPYRFDAISLMPTDLYGPGHNFQSGDSQVLPALIRRSSVAHPARIRRFHVAKARGDVASLKP